MIKVYSMSTCQDCINLADQIRESNQYEVIDIGSHVKKLKEFLKLRDNHPAFEQAKKNGTVGIPCFILEDGTVTLFPEEAGLQSKPSNQAGACSIDGTGC